MNSRHKKERKRAVVILISLFLVYCYYGNDYHTTGKSTTIQFNSTSRFLLLTVATENKSSVRRFQRSAEVNGLPLKILGLGVKYQGFGHKINILKEELVKHKDNAHKIILFSDAHDVLINSDVNRIIETFKRFQSKIVFSAEGNCWPDASLASRHPPVARGKRYLNSGLIIGYAPDLYRLVTYRPIANSANDQLHYIRIYINNKSRNELGIQLDHRSEMFQSLYLALQDVELRFRGKEAYLANVVYNTTPLIIHANGEIKEYVDTLGNYIPKAWNPLDGCTACLENTLDLSTLMNSEYPSIVVAIFIKDDKYLNEFFATITGLSYPLKKMHIFIYGDVTLQSVTIKKYLENVGEFKQISQISATTARNMAVGECLQRGCDYYFYLESDVHLDNANILQLLIEQNRPIVAPMLRNGTRMNFEAAVAPEFYPPSMDIVKNGRKGLWKVPCVSSCYLVTGRIISNLPNGPLYYESQDEDSSFCSKMRANDVDMFVSNRLDFARFR